MDETESKQNVDFLSIALEEIEAGNYETAKEFIGEVSENLKEEYE
jgi:DNA-directed RNA polymerase subunit K/omega